MSHTTKCCLTWVCNLIWQELALKLQKGCLTTRRNVTTLSWFGLLLRGTFSFKMGKSFNFFHLFKIIIQVDQGWSKPDWWFKVIPPGNFLPLVFTANTVRKILFSLFYLHILKTKVPGPYSFLKLEWLTLSRNSRPCRAAT